MDLTDIYRIFHLATTEYKFFSYAHGTFFIIDYILKIKQVLENVRKFKNGIQQQYKKQQKIGKYTCKLNNTFLNSQCIMKEIRGK
jgi:hypothetical protein